MINPERLPVTTAWRIVILLSILIWVGIISGIAHSAEPPTKSFGLIPQCEKRTALLIITRTGKSVQIDKYDIFYPSDRRNLIEWVSTRKFNTYLISCGITA